MGYYFCALICVLQILKISKSEPTLQIIKKVNGIEVPLFYYGHSGTNVTLNCKLLGVVGENNKTSNEADNQVAWGWTRPNIQFTNTGDLKKLADNCSKPLHQFLNKNGLNQATINFHPLLMVNAGNYFCMSLKHKLFNIVKIDVLKGSQHNTLSSSGFGFELKQNGPAVYSKYSCRNEMFVCNSRTSCVKNEYVCDNVKDCDDGSDENFYLCGNNPCKGKTKCEDGRCISASICCDFDKNSSCAITMQHSCCFKAIREKRIGSTINTGSSNHFSSRTIFLSNLDSSRIGNNVWRPQGSASNGIGGYKWNEISNPLKNSYASGNINSISNLNSGSSFTSTTTKTRFKVGKKALWIILAPVAAIGAAIKWCCGKRNQNLPTHENTNTNTPAGNAYQEVYISDTQQNGHNSDSPPAYKQAVKKPEEAAPFLKPAIPLPWR